MTDEKRFILEVCKFLLLGILVGCVVPVTCMHWKAEHVSAISECMATGKDFDWCSALFRTGTPPAKEIEHLKSEREKLRKAIEAYEKANASIQKETNLSSNKRLVSELDLPDPPPREVEPGSAADPCMQKCAEPGLTKGEKSKCYLKCHDWRRLCLNDEELIAYEKALEDCLVRSKDPLIDHENCEHMAAIDNCW